MSNDKSLFSWNVGCAFTSFLKRLQQSAGKNDYNLGLIKSERYCCRSVKVLIIYREYSLMVFWQLNIKYPIHHCNQSNRILKDICQYFQNFVKRKKETTTHLTVQQKASWWRIGDITKHGNNDISLKSRAEITNKSMVFLVHHTDT